MMSIARIDMVFLLRVYWHPASVGRMDDTGKVAAQQTGNKKPTG